MPEEDTVVEPKENLWKRLIKWERSLSWNKTVNFGVAEKTVWDWAQLLVVPVVLVIAAYLIDANQTKKREDLEESRIKRQTKLEDSRIAREVERDETIKEIQNDIEEKRIEREIKRDDERNAITILNNYRRSVSNYKISEKLGTEFQTDAGRNVVRALTISTLPQLDPKTKGALLTFIYQLELIAPSSSNNNNPIPVSIGLSIADFSGAYLERAYLTKANLEYANLVSANLKYANLVSANLEGANLEGANLESANLLEANIFDANLKGALLSGALLSLADLSGTPLSGANLQGAKFECVQLKQASYWQCSFRDEIKKCDAELPIPKNNEDVEKCMEEIGILSSNYP